MKTTTKQTRLMPKPKPKPHSIRDHSDAIYIKRNVHARFKAYCKSIRWTMNEAATHILEREMKHLHINDTITDHTEPDTGEHDDWGDRQ